MIQGARRKTLVCFGAGALSVAGFGDLFAASGPKGSGEVGATVLLIMIVLAPLQALDNILIATFAAFRYGR